jgi:(2Fe-2S) ferredoxin
MEKRPTPHHRIIFVCTNERPPGERPCCAAADGGTLRTRLKEMVKARRLRGRIRVSQAGCLDRCEDGPNIMVFPDNVWYSQVEGSDLDRILDEVVDSLRQDGALPRNFE